MKTLLAAAFICVCACAAYAGLWERQVEKNFEDTYSYGGQNYREGYTYRAGVGFARPQRPSDLALDYEYDIGLGCSGFDLGADFLNLMNAQALKNYMEGQLAAVIQAAPSLLLAYISPTLYDVVKSFESRAGALQLLKYRQCQDIVDAGTDWIAKSREAGRREQIEDARAEGQSLSEAIGGIPESSPFAGKRDYEGNPLGSIRLVRDGLRWAGADEEIVRLGPQIAGDYVIIYNAVRDESTVRFIRAVKTTDALLTENTEQFLETLASALQDYDNSNQVSKETLKALSVPSIPMVPAFISAIAGHSRFDRHILSSMLSSSLGVNKTAWQMRQITEKLQQALHNPYLDEGQRMLIGHFITDLERNRQTMLADAELEDKLAANKMGERIMGSYIRELEISGEKSRAGRQAEAARERAVGSLSPLTGLGWSD